MAERSEDFRSRLHQMDFGSPVDIRVTGLAIGLEFEDGAYAGALADRCLKAGLILGIDDDTLTLFPALTISRRTVHEAWTSSSAVSEGRTCLAGWNRCPPSAR